MGGHFLVGLAAAALAVPATAANVPTAFPAPGTYDVAIQVTLSAAPGARIHYSVDGSEPTPASATFEPHRLIPLPSASEGDKGLRREYVVKALCVAGGAPSAVATFRYVIAKRDKDAYVSAELHPGIWRIADWDTDKMYLVRGTRRALLIDTGMGGGDLDGYVGTLGGGLPIDVVVTHAHPDHVALLGQLQRHHDVYMRLLDLPMLKRFGAMIGPVEFPAIKDVREGAVFDLGGRRLIAHEVPGHTAGSIVLTDEEAGIVFSGDAVGSNRPAIPDLLWMQMEDMAPIDEYLSTLQGFRARVRGHVKEIYTGHNDTALRGEAYLDNLQRAAQRLVDEGQSALEPSLRPTGAWSVVVGDRLTDPDWAGINVRRESFLTAPPGQIATLSDLQIAPGAVTEPFQPGQETVTAKVGTGIDRTTLTATATSSGCRSLTVDGVGVASGSPHELRVKPGSNVFHITVTSPDGRVRRTYELVVTR